MDPRNLKAGETIYAVYERNRKTGKLELEAARVKSVGKNAILEGTGKYSRTPGLAFHCRSRVPLADTYFWLGIGRTPREAILAYHDVLEGKLAGLREQVSVMETAQSACVSTLKFADEELEKLISKDL